MRVDEHGSFLLGRVVVVCPARGRVSCHVVVRQVGASRLRILPLAFDMPSGRSSKIRLHLTAASLHLLRRLHSARAGVEITARQGSAQSPASTSDCAFSRPATRLASTFVAARSPVGRSPTRTRQARPRRQAPPTVSPAAG